jgi:hypothetical protein
VVMLSPLFVYALLDSHQRHSDIGEAGQELWGDDPTYQAYVANTPAFVTASALGLS